MSGFDGGNNKSEHFTYDRIAQAIFAAVESMGISDRQLSEDITAQVIKRLERGRMEVRLPFPGMEDLVGMARQKDAPSLASSEIRGMVQDALAAMGHPEIAEAYVSSEEDKSRMHSSVITRENNEEETVDNSGIHLSPNAKRVLEKRYLSKDDQGQVIETPEELFHRVAKHIASAEKIFDPKARVSTWEETFYQMMTNLEFLPNSPTLMNAGRALGQLSACFVLPVEDSMESIFDAVKYTALIHKSGGGTGFSFNRLRPETGIVGSTGGVASGPVSFMRAFDTATDVIKQGGMRRGANMAVLNVDHPDILRFITAKEDSLDFSNFNLSVAITEKFMDAVARGDDYDLINPHTKQCMGTKNAQEIFDKMVDVAWKSGDPGIIFIDRINKDNPVPNLGNIESTNPCGEQPLLPYESCNLGSVNLSKMVCQHNGKAEIDYARLATIVRLAVRFLDNVIEVNKFPLPQIEEMSRQTRKIGLGVMGFADMLIDLGIPYDSEDAVEIARDVMRFINKECLAASVELAETRNVFPAFEGSIYDVPGGPRLRNAARTTIAPTGTLSIIANCSSGIEPLFALSYVRTILEGEQFIEVNPRFGEFAKRGGFYSADLMKELAAHGSARDMEGVPQDIQSLFPTAHDISPKWHVRMQAAFQKDTDNAVSKTVNFPSHATREDIASVFTLAHKLGCKGVTIYRDGSKDAQVLSFGGGDGKGQETEDVGLSPRMRPKVTSGFTEKVSTGCGHIYVTVNTDEHGICEVFSSLGKAGGCASAQLEAISRLISLALRSGIDVPSVAKNLRGIRCPSIAWEEGHAVLSCPDAIASVLERYIKGEMQKNGIEASGGDTLPEDSSNHDNHDTNAILLVPTGISAGQCPDCGGLLAYQEGCHICSGCGYTKCG